MSTLPSLEPPVPITDVTGRSLLAGRRAVRANPAAAIAALSASLGPAIQIVATMWDRGACSTFTGSAARPGHGFEIVGDVKLHADMLRQIAPKTYPKENLRAGYPRTLGRSRYKGSSNAEFVCRTGLFLDCDDCGPADALRALLDALDIAYLYQSRPGKGRWHIELYFARPVERPADAHTDEALAAWTRNVYRPKMAWLLGLLSELGGLDCHLTPHDKRISISKLGADGASANRLLGLGNPYSRREYNDPKPETVHREGRFVDVEALLASTGYTPPAETPVRAPKPPRRKADALPEIEPSHASVDEPMEDAEEPSAEDLAESTEPDPMEAAVVAAYECDGLVVCRMRGLTMVCCPFKEGHSTGVDGDSSTAILENGLVKCLHGSCADRRPSDFLTALSPEAQFVVLDRLPAIAETNESALFAPSVLGLAAQATLHDPLRFAEVRREFALHPSTVERWMAHVRKERRS